MSSFGLLVCPALVSAALLTSGRAPSGTTLREHVDASGQFAFRAPSHWQVARPGPEITEAEGDSMLVRFISRRGDSGFDSLHVSCMQQRLRDAMEADPRVDYEYDFLQGELGDRRVLDSAFRTRYDEPVRGHKEWRQRNVTLVSPAGSLCVIAFSPTKSWKDSRNRALLDAIVESVSVR